MRSYTAIVERCQDMGLYVGFIPGFQGAHTQAETLDELNMNLREVVEMLLMATHQFVVCINNSDYEVSLDPRKLYQVLPDSESAKRHQAHIFDESGSLGRSQEADLIATQSHHCALTDVSPLSQP